MTKTQTTLLSILTTLVLLGALALWLAPTIAISYFSKSFENTDNETITSSISPDRDKKVIIKYGTYPFIFGPSGVEIYTQKKGGREKHWKTDEIANDGSSLSENNAHIEWRGNRATLTLSGAEQDDVVHEIEFENK